MAVAREDVHGVRIIVPGTAAKCSLSVPGRPAGLLRHGKLIDSWWVGLYGVIEDSSLALEKFIQNVFDKERRRELDRYNSYAQNPEFGGLLMP